MWKKMILFALVGVLIFTACAPEDEEGDGTVNLATSPYEDAISLHYLAKYILETEMGYEVNMQRADLGAIFTSVAAGDIDAYLATWLPVTHESYMEEHGDDMEDLGKTYEGARLGLTVPAYVDIDSIEELNAHSDNFDNEIIGIDSGAGIMELTEDAIEAYDLELELIHSSAEAMTATLQEAYENEEWIVVPGWTPHLKFARMDLKFLEDPELVYGEEEDVYVKAWKGFSEEKPEVAEFFENIYLTDEEYGELIDTFDDYGEGEEAEAAAEWMENNRDTVEEWIP